MSPARYPHWHLFRPLMDEGVPLNLAIPGTIGARLFYDPAGRLGLRVAASGPATLPTDIPPAITAMRVLEGGSPAIEVSSSSVELFPQVYFLLTLLADEVQLGGSSAAVALAEGLAAFRRLVHVKPVLSESAQLGLFGELWLLEQGVLSLGPRTLDTWVGPLGQPHDFRLGAADVEVKTTSGDRRSHLIASLTQLLPSPGRPLYVLSLGFQPAPAVPSASTLRDVIVRLRVHFEPAPVALARFERLLALAGWREETPDAQLSRFLLRLPPRLVLVDETCPRVTPSMIDGALGTALACRVLEVRYRIDLDGCGVPPANTTLAAFFGTTA